jgi:uncharacterized membrane protein
VNIAYRFQYRRQDPNTNHNFVLLESAYRPLCGFILQERAHMNNATWYSRFAKITAHVCGRPRTFSVAVGVILLWIVTGPIFHFSDTWQLVINTGTTIITFLMVFLIQNTQNRDTEAIQVKLENLSARPRERITRCLI